VEAIRTIWVLVGSNAPVIVGEGEGDGVEVFTITTGIDEVAGGDLKTNGAAEGGRYWEIQTVD
jgi:hypothetical protein